MKLFQRLLIAPAALGLLAPVAANADVLAKGEDLNAGAFASATKMSGSSVFTTGFIDTDNTNNNKLTSEYNYKIDINSSFTGSDNLSASIEAGNQNQLQMDSEVQSGNALSVASLYYQFPVGDFTVTAGPLLDQDDVIAATTSIYSDAFRLAAMPWGTSGETGAGVAVEYVATNGWKGSVNLLSVDAADATEGMFTQESQDSYTATIGYDADSGNYGGGIIYTALDQVASDTRDQSVGGGVWFRPDDWPTISLTLDKYDDENGANSSDFTVGLDYDGWGAGRLSGAWQARDNAGVDSTRYEVYYNYPVNDGVSVQGGVFSEEVNGQNNTEGVVVETFFKF